MAQTIKLKRSATTGNIPTDAQLELGEIGINTFDGKLFFKKNDGSDQMLEIVAANKQEALKVSKGSAAPVSADDGDLFYNTATNKLYSYDGTTWAEIGSTLSTLNTENLAVLGNTTLGDAASDTLSVSASAVFGSPVDFQNTVDLQETNTEIDNVNIKEWTQDVVGAMVSSNSENGIAVTYQDVDGTLDFDVNDPVITVNGNTHGSATMTNLGNTTITTTVDAVRAVASAPTAGADGGVLSEGDVYYNTTDNQPYAYDGTAWNSMGGGGSVVISDTAPTGSDRYEGAVWLDTVNGGAFAWNDVGSVWIQL